MYSEALILCTRIYSLFWSFPLLIGVFNEVVNMRRFRLLVVVVGLLLCCPIVYLFHHCGSTNDTEEGSSMTYVNNFTCGYREPVSLEI